MSLADPLGLPLGPEDAAVLARAEATQARGESVAHELELATAALYLEVSRRPANAAFLAEVAAGRRPAREPAVRIGLVPGAFYEDHADTGADGAAILRVLAARNLRGEIIPIQSFGRLEENARIILDWLAADPRPAVLISLSKGTADLRVALRRAEARGERLPIVAWISLSGLGTGTPLVGWLRRRPWRWWAVWLILRLRGQRMAAVEDLRHDPDSPLAGWPAPPPGVQLVHIHGFPLQRHLTHRWAPKGYRRLAPLGPNDASVLLADVAAWPGLVVPLWGVDHYLQPRHDLTVPLGRVVDAVLARCG